MSDESTGSEGYRARIAELEALVASQARAIERLEVLVAELRRQAGRNSGNSGKPPSRDPADERKRQAEERAKRKAETTRRKGKQRGSPGSGLAMSESRDAGAPAYSNMWRWHLNWRKVRRGTSPGSSSSRACGLSSSGNLSRSDMAP